MASDSFVARHSARIIAAACVVTLYFAAQLPNPSQQERATLAARFDFESVELPHPSPCEHATSRDVTPSLEKIRGWISAVGAAIALCDLDGDGLPNEFVQVDPRCDSVLLGAVPETGSRQRLTTLNPRPLPYDPKTMAPMGCVPGDLDEDGDLDILVYYWGRTPIAFLRTGESFAPSEVVDSSERWFTNALTRADVDGDGHLDLVIGNYFADGSFLLGPNGDDSQVMQGSMSRADNGGGLRILLWESRTKMRPTVKYREVVPDLDEALPKRWALALGTADLDGDLLPEIYVANDFGPDHFLHNRSSPGKVRFGLLTGEERLASPSSCVVGKDSFKGMGVDFSDVNGDGHLDIHVSNIAAEYALEESHFLFLSTGDTAAMARGVAPYVHAAEELGVARSSWSWDSRFGDFDNDGNDELLQATGFLAGDTDRWPELQELATANDMALRHVSSWPVFRDGDDLCGHEPNPFFVKGADGRFVDLSPELRLDAPHVTRGIATADVDGDGDLDFAIANQWQSSWFRRNTAPAPGNFLGIHLMIPVAPTDTATFARAGHPSNLAAPARYATGAMVRVRGAAKDGGATLSRVARVDGGDGHSGVRSPALHFGLGAWSQDAALSVEIRWRDPEGAVHDETISLKPGWHSVVLGWPNGRKRS